MTSIPAAICRIFCNNFKRYYLKNGRLFLDFLFHFWNVHEISNILKKRTPFDNQRVNGFQTPLKVRRHHYYPFFRLNYGKLSWKKTALLWSKILRLFANTFPAMTSIQAAICRIFGNNFKRYYLKNGRLFLDFFSISEMWIKFTTFWRKGWVSWPNYFRNYCFGKSLLLKHLERFPWEHHSVIN